MANPQTSPFYQTRAFDKDTLFKQRYGTNASRKDKRQFERYWNSEQRAADELAHTKAESQKYLASVDAYTQNALNKLKGTPAPPAPTAPEFYKTKDFRTTKLAEMYGTDPSKRDLRQFERYMQSEQGQADWLAHEQAESQKYLQSWDDRIAFNKQRMVEPKQNATSWATPWWQGVGNAGVPTNAKGGRINYFQNGGAAPKQDIKAQVVALVQAAMQGDQKATQQVNQIMEAAKAGDQQALQIAQIMEQVVKELQGQATSAKWGSKLNYVKSLKYAKGGKTCPACEKKVEMKACGGKKAKKRYFGGLV